jgi:branched-chain amino acid transport system ATP-binding protein
LTPEEQYGSPALSIRDLHVRYGQVTALHGVSIDVQPGRVTALVGANGAGKSSLLRAVAGIISPQRGAIEIPAGVDITQIPAHRRVRELGVVLIPEGRGVFGSMTVIENLALGQRIGAQRRRGMPKEGVGPREGDFEEVWSLFPALYERRSLTGRLLSGGEQQMLTIARALLCAPRLLLVDEPSMGLAPLLVERIFETLRTVIIGRDLSILLVEQDTTMALAIADWAYALRSGNIVASSAANELAASPSLLSAYLGE